MLILSAQNAALKALLIEVRPAFVAHLEHAQHVQAPLGKERAGGQCSVPHDAQPARSYGEDEACNGGQWWAVS